MRANRRPNAIVFANRATRAIVFALWAFAPGGAGAQEEPVRLFAPHEWRSSLRLAWFLDDLDRTAATSSGRSVREVERGTEEELELSSDGYLYHPRLLEYDGRFALRLRQYRFESEPRAYGGRSREAISRYHLNLRLFRRRFLSSRVQLSRSLSDLNSTFERNRSFLTTSQLLVWEPVRSSRKLSVALGRTRREVWGALDTRELRKEARVTSSHKDGAFHGDLDGEWESWNQTVPDLEVNGYGLDLRESYAPAREGRESVTLQGRYLRHRGDIDTRNAYAGLSAQSPTWRQVKASGELSISRLRTLGRETRTRRGRLGVSHRLYRSVTTSVSLSRRETDQGGAEGISESVEGSVRYRKRIPGGRLGLRFRLDRTRTDEKSSRASTLVAVEEHRPGPQMHLLLERDGIDLETILVTDEEERKIFVEGVDYLVFERGGRVEIQILPSGEISQGDLLHVRYEYDAGPELRYIARGRGVGGSLELWGRVVVRLSWDHIDEEPLAGPPERLGDIRDRRADAEVRIGSLRSGVSYRRHDEIRTPYIARSVYQSLGARLGGRLRADLSARYARTDYTDRDETTEGWRGNAKIGAALAGRTRLVLLFSAYRIEQPTFKNDGHLWEVELESRLPAVTFTLTARRQIDDLELRGKDGTTMIRAEVTRRLL